MERERVVTLMGSYGYVSEELQKVLKSKGIKQAMTYTGVELVFNIYFKQNLFTRSYGFSGLKVIPVTSKLIDELKIIPVEAFEEYLNAQEGRQL